MRLLCNETINIGAARQAGHRAAAGNTDASGGGGKAQRRLHVLPLLGGHRKRCREAVAGARGVEHLASRDDWLRDRPVSCKQTGKTVGSFCGAHADMKNMH
jgi:hypothetical protein